MNKEKKTLSARGIAEIAIMSAIALGLDFLQSGLWRGIFANGGSIGLAMIPILIMCYRRGFVSGLITATVLAFLQLLGGPYLITASWYSVLFQFLLDYLLAYPVVAFAGLFYNKYHESKNDIEKSKWLVIGTIVGGFAKFLCHFLSGFIFWASSTPADFDFVGGSVVYSLIYNGSYMIPNIVISLLVLCLIQIKAPKIFIISDPVYFSNEKAKGDNYEKN